MMPFGDSPILFDGPLYPSASRLCVRLTLFYLLVLLAARRQQVAVGGGGVAIRRRPAGSGGRRQGESGERERARGRGSAEAVDISRPVGRRNADMYLSAAGKPICVGGRPRGSHRPSGCLSALQWPTGYYVYNFPQTNATFAINH
jgi:hypothetical protein